MVEHVRIFGWIKTLTAIPWIVGAIDEELGPVYGVGPGSVEFRLPIQYKRRGRPFCYVLSSKTVAL